MKRGFTLVEVLIAVSLFSLASIIASDILVDVVGLERKTAIENDLYEDVQVVLQQLTKEIENGTIDYEEYYSMGVIQWKTLPEDKFYGINYGIYGSRFYNPGRRSDGQNAQNPRDLGLECSVLQNNDECAIYWTHSADINTGKNPFNGNNLDVSSAFCDKGWGFYCGDPGIANGTVTTNELYLIDKTGTKKTIIAKKLISGTDYALGLMRMEGRDMDQNGVVDVFTCAPEFKCYDGSENNKIFQAILYPFIQEAGRDYIVENNIRLPQNSDLNDLFIPNQTQFIPISPLRSKIKNLQFIISPIEDPYKAYAEDKAQFQPSVTIILTMELSTAAQEEYPGIFQPITVQTTVAAGVKNRIESYPPVKDILRSTGNHGKSSWISEVLGPAGVP